MHSLILPKKFGINKKFYIFAQEKYLDYGTTNIVGKD